MQILTYQGKLTGSISNGDFDVDEKNNNAITGWREAPRRRADRRGIHLRPDPRLQDPGPGWARRLGSHPHRPRQSRLAHRRSSAQRHKTARHSGRKDRHRLRKRRQTEPGLHPASRVITASTPDYTPEARAAKFSGKCVVALTIDTQGNPINVHIEKPIGMGLDENAINAVKQYRFTPAMQDGVPIAKRVHIEVDFQYY